jgi:hypothetical protein
MIRHGKRAIGQNKCQNFNIREIFHDVNPLLMVRVR